MTADQIRSLPSRSPVGWVLDPPSRALTVFQEVGDRPPYSLPAIVRPCFKRTASLDHWERYIVGLITDLKRKSVEPIALATGVAVLTL